MWYTVVPHQVPFILQRYRLRGFTPYEDIRDIQHALEDYNSVSPYEDLKGLKEVRDRLDMTDLNFRALKARLVKQEHTLKTLW